MKGINILLISLFTLFFSCAFSQDKNTTAIEVLQKASDAYNKALYTTFSSKYSIYLDYKTSKPYDQYEGFVLKKNGVTYFKIKNTEFVSFNNKSIKINHDQKAVIIGEQENKDQEILFSLNNYLKGFNSKLTTSNDFFICELTPIGKISQTMLQKVIIHIKKADYSMTKQVLFLSESMQSEDVNGKVVYSIPRIEIVFNPRKKNEVADNLLVTKENYFTEKSNKILLSKRLATYQLF